LRKITTKTLDLAEKLRKQGELVETLDTLARLLHDGKAGGETMQQRNYHVIGAKVSVAALFLFLEREAIHKKLPGYRQLLKRFFPDVPKVGFRRAIELSPHRILTFNYDRLFELAFRQYFLDFDGTEALYCPTVLNSGLHLVDPKNLEIDLNKFSFLKLHGSAGFYGISEQIYPSKENGHVEHIHSIPDPKSLVTINDNEFFYAIDPADRIHSGKPKPVLITFPHERYHLNQFPSNLSAYKDYTPAIWGAAHSFVSQAEEINIIGYSCPDADAKAVSSLLAASKNCRRITIENISPGDVCLRLYNLLPKSFSGEIVCKNVSF